MRPRVSVLDDYQSVALSSADWSEVEAAYDIDVITEHLHDAGDLVRRLRDTQVVVAMRERTAFSATTLASLPELRLLVTTGMANASIDIPAARAHGITVCGTGGAGNSMPELTFGMMIALSRHFVEEDRNVRAGRWQETIGPGLSGRTLGIVGLGRLGSRVAVLAQAFGMAVTAWSPHLTAERAAAVPGVQAVTKEQLFAGSDFVSIHMALTDTTRDLIGAAELDLMARHAFLINTARGPIVNETALVSALERQSIAGAALDVYDIEPLPTDHPLRTMPNTLLLPHIGYVCTEAYQTFYADAVEDIVAFGAGAPVRELA
ncbi:D-2-hydroxyacid dehydrogenase family protein [Jatrophihabitans sp. DSM 45814]